MKKKNKINPERREIILTMRVNASEMREILARANAYAEGNVSALIRYLVIKGLNKKPLDT